VPGGLREISANGDTWVQDWFEPMYASVPTPQGTHGTRLLLRSDQGRPASKRTYLVRGRNVGVVWQGKRRGFETLNSFGNLETIPPHEGYPAGRIILGERRGSCGCSPPKASRTRS
jgi:protein-arginine deiminase